MEEYMKVAFKLLAGLSVLMLIISCSSTPESRGNAAYNAAKKLQGDQKRLQLKTAYLNYDKAVKENPDKVSNRLRNRYIEMTLARANMVLNEGAAHMEAIPLFLDDIEKNMTADVQPELKQEYALFIAQMADSSLRKGRVDEARERLDKAIAVASDPLPLKEKKKTTIDQLYQQYYDEAEINYANGKTNKDANELVRAEFNVLCALLFDSTRAEAKDLLSKLRKENRGTYSAYLTVIDPIPDSAIFKIINKWDILLAIPTMENRGRTVRTVIDIYNYSWNPLRLKTENFFLVDVNGKKYKALPARLEPEMLDQEHEAKLKMSFPKPSAEVKMLLYENGEHVSEKHFM
jgi:tetratricopeptide (TPR) repeat protein